jgi:hypothetical protein
MEKSLSGFSMESAGPSVTSALHLFCGYKRTVERAFRAATRFPLLSVGAGAVLW